MEQNSSFRYTAASKFKEHMSILSLKDASLTLKAGPLFEHTCLEIEAQDKIGLIGQNGSGKSSLLSLLAKDFMPDSGEVAWEKDFSYSFLPQDIDVPEEATLGDFLYSGKATEIAHNQPSDRSLPAISIENRYRALCRELGFRDLDMPMRNLSGGEKKKAALARVLAPSAKLLILDEPTNHLDIQTIEWLESRLRASRQAFILVTHDRWFLDSVVNSIVEIDRHELRAYPGSYSQFLEKKAAYMASLDRMENKRLANLKIELEWLHRGARARATKSERRKKDVEKMRESLLEKQRPRIEFSSSEARLGKKVCVFRDLGMAFGPRRLFGGFSWEIGPGAKVGIMGPNGSGKTSLLKIISGRLLPTEGSIELGETVHMSVFEQTNDSIDGELSILDYIQEHADHFVLPDGAALDAEFLLERFGFPRDFQKQKLRTLSGGELRRLMLVRVLAESPNFLLLDEPTNDLDIDTIESLESYCAEFPGSLLIVSHDRLLVDRLADELLIFNGQGQIERFHGSYLDWKLETEATGSPDAGNGNHADKPADKANGKTGGRASQPSLQKPTKLSYKEKQELAGLMDEIDALDEEKRRLDEFFQKPDSNPAAYAETGRRYEEIDRLTHEKLSRWEELAARE
ncbi:MAG: ABC-F family ATP-binding cassette domain-containing protein [Spirochaetaceae bacterium]|nr:ABC-F family ATP-binding cassette domain-containing protein [Spirochaetaceae bacterium]